MRGRLGRSVRAVCTVGWARPAGPAQAVPVVEAVFAPGLQARLVIPGASVRRIAVRGAARAWDRPRQGLEVRSPLPWPGRAAEPALAAISAVQMAGFFAASLR